jgi:hypothetical protein
MSHDVCWLFSTVLLLVGSLTLLLLAYAFEDNGVATAVPVLTLLVAIPSLVSLVLQVRMNRQVKQQNLLTDEEHDSTILALDAEKKLDLLTAGLRPTSTSVSLYFGPAISLFVVILVRLAASPFNFEGDPSNLDFGPKNGVENGEPNVGFTNEFNTYGHCLQGVLGAMLAFPAVSGVLTQLFTCKFRGYWQSCNNHVWNLIKVTAVFMCIYPTYNLTKRLIRTSESFATSSFCNNGLEWAFGFMIGLALGNFISIVVKRSALNQILDQKFPQEGESWLLGTQQPPKYQPRVNGLICIMGIVFLITVFVASVFFGLSWHSCPNGEVDCVNYSDEGISAEVLAVMLIIPIVIISVVSCGECMRLRK